MIAPIPTAPMGAASPNCPTTPVSTAPKMGTVALEMTMGMATDRTLRCVTVSGVIPSGAIAICPLFNVS